jgi:predicted RNase H-like nuclease
VFNLMAKNQDGDHTTPTVSSMPIIAGIDGCPSGWLCLTKDLSTGVVQARILVEIGELLTFDPRPAVVLIDVPIGLTDSGPRSCDQAARALLRRPRASSVFPAPIRPMLAASTYAAACAIGVQTDGRKPSRQLWNIMPKIREVDAFLRADVTHHPLLREVHPEVSFCLWNVNKAMMHNKKSPAGRSEREALVLSVFGTAYSSAQSTLPRGRYTNDDLLDAVAALWTAERVMTGNAKTLPELPPSDSCGLRMEIVV